MKTIKLKSIEIKLTINNALGELEDFTANLELSTKLGKHITNIIHNAKVCALC